MPVTTMSSEEREQFLADVHVGVLSIAAPPDEAGDERGPLTVPVWYGYEPGGDVWILTGGKTKKAELLRRARRASLCAQTEAAPYAYVTVEGPVRITESFDPDQRRALAIRYLGEEFGELYLAATEMDAADDITVRIHPERWLSVDYRKQFGS